VLAAGQHIVEQHDAFAQRPALEGFAVEPDQAIERIGRQPPCTGMVCHGGGALVEQASKIEVEVTEGCDQNSLQPIVVVRIARRTRGRHWNPCVAFHSRPAERRAQGARDIVNGLQLVVPAARVRRGDRGAHVRFSISWLSSLAR
jgi:hypothetical protein